jgi:ribosomal protein S18 acetylase RimI-like enzyme
LEVSQISVSDWTDAFDKQITHIEEEAFPHTLGDTRHYLRKLVDLPGAVFIAAKVKGTIVGYAAGAKLENFGEVPGVKQDPHFDLEDTFYLESMAVLSEYQGKGIGKHLFSSIALRTRKNGFQYIAGHMKEGFAERWRGVPLAQFDNYYGTGETFEYFRRELKLGDWTEGCKSLITVQGIFAGFASVILVTLLTIPLAPEAKTFPVIVAAIIATLTSIVLLIYSAERSTDALDHIDPHIYTNMLLYYNTGVTLFLIGIGLTVSLYVINLWLGGAIPQIYLALLIIIWLPIAFSMQHWIRDIIWLSKKANRRAYTLSFECEEED